MGGDLGTGEPQRTNGQYCTIMELTFYEHKMTKLYNILEGDKCMESGVLGGGP